MPFFSKARSFFRNLFSLRAVESELDREVHSHLDMLADENVRSGMPPVAAQRAALLELGGLEQVKEEVRDQRIGTWLRSFLADCRFAVRQLRKSPAFAVIAVITLALGISINATMFSMISAFVLAKPDVQDPDHVVVITSVSPTPGFQSDASQLSVPNFLNWRGAAQGFQGMAAADLFGSVNLASQGPAEAVRCAAVSPNFFSVLGVSPQIGRSFADGEDRPGRDHVVLLSHQLWEHHFASDPSLVDGTRTIRLNRENYTVIGVLPQSFHLLGYTPQLWMPLVFTEANTTPAARKDRSLYLFARLRQGVGIAETGAQMEALAKQAGDSFPETEKGWGARVRTLPDFLTYTFGFRDGAAIMMITAGFVLMIACANVSGLLLARASRRSKEIAIRVALGAGRLRIVRQLLTENLIIAVMGGGSGLLLASWGIAFLRSRLNFNEAARTAPISLDWHVLWFAVFASLLCVFLCGVAPALHASRTDINTNLKEEGRTLSTGRSHSRLRTFMVAGQITVALVLLVGTALLFRAVFLIEHQDLGFRTENLLTASVNLDDAHYKDAQLRSLFVENTLGRLRQIPGAASVAVVSDLPATGPPQVTLQIMGQPELPANQRLTALTTVATPGYFVTAGIPLLHGRAFTELDGPPAEPVALVNEQFVHRFLHDREPLGQHIRLDVTGSRPAWLEIVGVVSDVKSYSEDARVDPQVFEPFLQRPVSYFSFLLRSASDPARMSADLRRAVAEADPELPLDRVMTMPALIQSQRGAGPLFVNVLAGFAALALLLSAIGIYGLVAYAVSQRTHEIGIRIAMGARAHDVSRMILWQGTKITAIGMVFGLLLSVPLPGIFDSLFASLRFREPVIYVGGPLIVLLVATLATLIPARRASSVDPLYALRQD